MCAQVGGCSVLVKVWEWLATLSITVGHDDASPLPPPLHTSADDSLRITRGDGGSVFVMVRDSDSGNASSSSEAVGWQPQQEAAAAQQMTYGGVGISSSSADGSVSFAAAAEMAAETAVGMAAEAVAEAVELVEPSAVIEEEDFAAAVDELDD